MTKLINLKLEKYKKYVGKQVFVRKGYDFVKGILISVGPKRLKISTQYFTEPVRATSSDVALPDEKVVVIWEQWKGPTNGWGGYRLEKELYPEHRIEARKHPSQFHLKEKNKPIIILRPSYIIDPNYKKGMWVAVYNDIIIARHYDTGKLKIPKEYSSVDSIILKDIDWTAAGY